MFSIRHERRGGVVERTHPWRSEKSSELASAMRGRLQQQQIRK